MSENLGIVLHQAIRENDCVLAATSRMRGPKIPTSTGLSRVLLLRLHFAQQILSQDLEGKHVQENAMFIVTNKGPFNRNQPLKNGQCLHPLSQMRCMAAKMTPEITLVIRGSILAASETTFDSGGLKGNNPGNSSVEISGQQWTPMKI
jgi:hypothetical protein